MIKGAHKKILIQPRNAIWISILIPNTIDTIQEGHSVQNLKQDEPIEMPSHNASTAEMVIFLF